jgi:hypothetical protein
MIRDRLKGVNLNRANSLPDNAIEEPQNGQERHKLGVHVS